MLSRQPSGRHILLRRYGCGGAQCELWSPDDLRLYKLPNTGGRTPLLNENSVIQHVLHDVRETLRQFFLDLLTTNLSGLQPHVLSW